MRLPQSIVQSLSVRPIHFLLTAMAILLLGAAPVAARAATSQLACTPPHLGFGSTVVGQSETMLVTVTNGGQTSVTMSGMTVSNAEFTPSQLSLPLVLAAGQSVDLTVTFIPATLGWTGGTVKFSSNANVETLTLEVGGTGVTSESVTASPSTLSFGQVAIGATSTLSLVLTNDRTWKVTLPAPETTGSEFSTSGVTFPITLGAGQSVTLDVSFTPQSAGTVGGSVFVVGPALTIPLAGTGTAASQLTLTPALLSFGNVPDGTTETLPITISASGSSVTVSSASSSSAQFVLDGASFPLTIAAGQTMSFNVAFTPQSGGTVSGALSFASNASNSPALESLTGIGTVTAYSVNLSWSPSSDVTGYNVYRSAVANGAYSKINSTLDPNTAYTDSTVVAGQTYYYAATSVNSSGQESPLSTPPVEAAVP